MNAEIQLISDGDGIAVIGEPSAVERFLSSEGLPSKDLDLPRLGKVLSTGGAATQAGAEIAANSGRWVKLTEESAQAMKKYKLIMGSSPGVSPRGLDRGRQEQGVLQLVRTPGSALTNPALLSGVGGIMAQLAMQQAMEEITDCLARIDEKLDDVLRGSDQPGAGAHGRRRFGRKGSDEGARGRRPGLGGHRVEGASHVVDDLRHPGVCAART